MSHNYPTISEIHTNATVDQSGMNIFDSYGTRHAYD